MLWRNFYIQMLITTHILRILVANAMLTSMLFEGYRGEHNIFKFSHWTKELYFYILANFHGSNAMNAIEETLIFYNYPLAFNPAKAKLALEEKGLKYTEKQIDLFNGQSLEPWYMRLNPHGWSPTLVTGKEILTESLDIIRWVDRQGSSLGGNTANKTFVSEWLSKVDAWDGNLFAMSNSNAGGMFKYVTKFKIKVAQSHATRNVDMSDLYMKKIANMNKVLEEVDDAAVVEANKMQLVALLDEAEMRLGKSRYLAGNQYTIADVIFTPVVYRLFSTKKDQQYLTTRSNIRQYYEELKQRPSYNKVFHVSDSSLSAASLILPTLIKIFFINLIKRY
ncbi:hypothetical protein M758_3G098700 [Ceratodon purpureus]|nr:hypothetical protein M758_3G098700 [Ceratodon purpureus]